MLYVTGNTDLWEVYEQQDNVVEYGKLTGDEIDDLCTPVHLKAPAIPAGFTVTRLPNRQKNRTRQTI